MIRSKKLTVVLDACVLYPAPVRDILLSLANEGLFKPMWSNEIQNEWTRNLLSNRPDLSKEVLQTTVFAMNKAFPDSNVVNFEELINSVNLPDKNDRHVLACAIRSNSSLIITFNLKDFPDPELIKFDLKAKNPDEFISSLIEINSNATCKGFTKMVKRLKNPPKTKIQILETLRNCGLILSAKKLENCL